MNFEEKHVADPVLDSVKCIKKNKDNEPNVLDSFPIFINLPDGNTSVIYGKSTYSISDVLDILQGTLDEDLENCRLLYGGTPLERDRTLEYYKIHQNSTLFLNGRIRGGGIDGCKYLRLTNLFRSVINGHPDYDDLMDQLNRLNTCDLVADLKVYDQDYPQKRV